MTKKDTTGIANGGFRDIVASVVAAYVSNNSLPAAELPALIASIYSAVATVSGPQPQPVAETAPLEPAVPIKKSVTREFIICLEDGKKYKSLRRHLNSSYDMTPEAYRAKWGLPKDYPMVAPAYAERRSKLAKEIGLGVKRKSVTASASVPAAKTGRGRPKKAA